MLLVARRARPKASLRLFLLVLLTLVYLCAPSPLRAQGCCHPEVAVEATWTEEPDSPSWAAADALGAVYVLWDSSDYAVSYDDGRSWRAFTPVADWMRQETRLVDELGNVLFVYIDGSGLFMVHSADQARTFSSPRRLGDADGSGDPRLDMGPDGLTAAAWTNSAGNQQLYAAVSWDRGHSWGLVRVLHEQAGWMDVVGLVVTDRSIVVFYSHNLGVWAVTSLDRGGSWSFRRTVTALPNSKAKIRFDASGDGHVQAVYWGYYESDDSTQIRLKVSSDGGLSWPLQETILDSRAGEYRPEVKQGSGTGGHVRVVWSWMESSPVDVLLTKKSIGHGMAGTWPADPVVVDAGSIHPHDLSFEEGPAGLVDVIHSDYRDNEACVDTTCESVLLQRSCDGGTAWIAEPMHLDTDIPPMGTHSENPKVTRSASGRLHVCWKNNRGAAGRQSAGRHVGLDPAAHTPRILLTGGPPTECGPHTYNLHVVPESVAWCGEPLFQWFMDGEPLPGATGWDYRVPPDVPPGAHAFHYEVSCGETAPCGAVATPYTLATSQVPHPPAGGIDGRLMVSWRYPDLRLSWEDGSFVATGYSLYSGTIRSLHEDAAYDHEALACHLEREPPDARETAFDTTLPAVNTYYLVAPATCVTEGHVGSDSAGSPRPVAGSPPPCGPLLP